MRAVLEINGLFDGANTTSDAAIAIENGGALPARVMERARPVATKHQEGVRGSPV